MGKWLVLLILAIIGVMLWFHRLDLVVTLFVGSFIGVGIGSED